MALVKFGGGVTQMSGSIGGTTFSRNTYGNYARARTTPTNPRSTRQNLVRATIGFLAAYWAQQLTDAERAAWNLYAEGVVMSNRLGEPTYLSGYNHFLRSNSIPKRAALPIYDPGPTVFELPEQDPLLSFTGSEATQILTIAFDDTMDWCDESSAFVHVFQGQPQNHQREFFGGPWRYLGHLTGSATSGLASPQTMAVQFAIAEDQRDWLYARLQRADGRLTEPFRADAYINA